MKVLVDAYVHDANGIGDVKQFVLAEDMLYPGAACPLEDETFTVDVPGVGERMLRVTRRIFDYTYGQLVLCCSEAELYTPWRNR